MARDDLIQLRAGTHAHWVSSNPVLHEDEISYDRTLNQIRIGNGVTHWVDIVPIGALSDSAIAAAVAEYLLDNPVETGFVYEQPEPLGTWVISHTLGRKPDVSVYLPSGEKVLTDITASAISVTVSFPNPTAGSAVLT